MFDKTSCLILILLAYILIQNCGQWQGPPLTSLAAILLVLVLGIIIMLWAGLVYGPTLAFAFLGALLTVPLLLVYMATCLAVPFFYLCEHREEFTPGRHIILPAIPFIFLAIVLYFQFSPLPQAPFILVGPINAAWLVPGIIIVVVLNLRAPQVLKQGNRLFAESEV